MIAITIALAIPEKQVEMSLNVEENCTIAQAISLSNVTAEFSEMDLGDAMVGVFGKCVTLDTIVKDGDRVEIYRTLQRDPKELRRMKVEPKKRRGDY